MGPRSHAPVRLHSGSVNGRARRSGADRAKQHQVGSELEVGANLDNAIQHGHFDVPTPFTRPSVPTNASC